MTGDGAHGTRHLALWRQHRTRLGDKGEVGWGKLASTRPRGQQQVAVNVDTLDPKADLIGVGRHQKFRAAATHPCKKIAHPAPVHLTAGLAPFRLQPILDPVLVPRRTQHLGQGLDRLE